MNSLIAKHARKAVGKSPFGFKVIVLDQRGEAKGWQDRLREILNHWTR